MGLMNIKKIALFLFLPCILFAKASDPFDNGNTAFLMLSTALVMIMIPAIGMFYGGIVSSKNVLNTLIQSFAILCIVSVEWVLIGYTMVFGPDFYHVIGNLKWVGLNGINPESIFPISDIPVFSYVAYQGMFAAISPAIINGSVVERFRFPALLLFTLLWSVCVYNPLAHWVWGDGGFLQQMGALDFAGGTVVHITSGFSALAACLYIGKRTGKFEKSHPSHNLTISFIGATLLWFGWFGFNGGSTLDAGSVSTSAILITNLAAASGALGWMFLEWLFKHKASALGIMSGAIIGLVAITPAAGYVGVISALLIGLIAGMACYLFNMAKNNLFHYDDSLDVFGIHGIGGVVGAILTGVFASAEVNPMGADGLLYGNPKQLFVQIAAALISAVFAFVMTIILLKITDMLTPVRASLKEEKLGLDLTQHGEEGYHF
jgi:Amt family ammonium transporter